MEETKFLKRKTVDTFNASDSKAFDPVKGISLTKISEQMPDFDSEML